MSINNRTASVDHLRQEAAGLHRELNGLAPTDPRYQAVLLRLQRLSEQVAEAKRALVALY